MNYSKYYNTFFQKIPKKIRIEFMIRYSIEHFIGWGILSEKIGLWDKKIQNKIYTSICKIKKETIHIKELNINKDPKEIQKTYIKKGIPFVIRGGANNWKAFKEWDFSFFKQKYGDHPVMLTNHYDLGDHTNNGESLSNLKNIIDGISNDSMNYARFNPLLDTYKDLQKDLDQNWLNSVRDTNIKKHHVLFIGNTSTKTNIHNAANDNIFVQIRGKKKWLIWDQRAHYIINPKVNRAPAKSSNINPNDKIISSNPSFKYLPKCEIILNQGDIIFIPAYLWHYVENLTPTIGVGIRWLSPQNSFRNNTLFSILEIFNTSPSIFTTLNWKKGFDFNKIMIKNLKKKDK